MRETLFDLHGRSALVTGGGNGLGRHFAKVLATAGARVILCARQIDRIRACADEINAAGGRAEYFPMDVTDSASVVDVFDKASAGGVISIVVNNAGINSVPSLLEVSEAEWENVLATNLKGSWLVAREAVVRLVRAQTGGTIINIASVLGVAAQKGTGPYGASKAAVLHLTHNMALEWAKYNVRVNAIAPGYFSTGMADSFVATDAGQAMIRRIPQRRLGNIEDLSGAILLLASDASAYMTGSTITVDGGQSMPMV